MKARCPSFTSALRARIFSAAQGMRLGFESSDVRSPLGAVEPRLVGATLPSTGKKSSPLAGCHPKSAEARFGMAASWEGDCAAAAAASDTRTAALHMTIDLDIPYSRSCVDMWASEPAPANYPTPLSYRFRVVGHTKLRQGGGS